jgi:hypothetical protein
MNALRGKTMLFLLGRANIYDFTGVRKIMRSGVFFSIFFMSLICMCGLSTITSAQLPALPPEIELECDENVALGDSSDWATMANCILSNPTLADEEVELVYPSTGELQISGPQSLTVGASSEESFEVALDASEDYRTEAGEYLVNITASVTLWGGIPVDFLGSSDDAQIAVEFLPYTRCQTSHSYGSFGGEVVESGQDVIFRLMYDCRSNEDMLIDVSLHLLEKGSTQEGMWPSGFNDMSTGSCEVQNPMGVAECEFELTTPPNLQEAWEGCVILLDEVTDPQYESQVLSCSSNYAVPLTVNAKEVEIPSVGIEINGTILEDLGITEENKTYFAIGGGSVVVLVVALVIVLRRR